MKIIYRAFDGEEFESEEDCVDYEDSFEKVPYAIDRDCEVTDDPSRIMAMVVNTNEESQWVFKNIPYYELGFYEDEYLGEEDVPRGLYIWDDAYERYSVYYNDTFAMLKNVIEKLEVK